MVGHTVMHGVCDNPSTWWDNTTARHVGCRPLDSSAVHRAAVEARQPVLDADDPATHHQGSVFVRTGPFVDAPAVTGPFVA